MPAPASPSALGHGHPAVREAILAQLDAVWHVSSLYHIPSQQRFAQLLSETYGDGAVFLCNSGAEANETAVKLARKHHWRRGDTDRVEILSATHAFHGRTLTGLALTPKAVYREGFGPMPEHFRNLPISQLADAVSERTAAVFIEPIQGEGGCRVVEDLQALRDACDAHGALLVTDEIQCGLGRTGTLHPEVRRDIVTLAKALGGGLPLGAAVAVNPEVQDAFSPGDHGSTFGGNPWPAPRPRPPSAPSWSRSCPPRCAELAPACGRGWRTSACVSPAPALHAGGPPRPTRRAGHRRPPENGVLVCPSGRRPSATCRPSR